jgi:hypothetical protein
MSELLHTVRFPGETDELPLLDSIASLPRLLGAALALGAETVLGVTDVERDREAAEQTMLS